MACSLLDNPQEYILISEFAKKDYIISATNICNMIKGGSGWQSKILIRYI